MLDDLRSMARADADLDDVRMPTYHVSNDADASAAISALIDYFGADRARHTVRLRFPEQTRYLSRQDLYAAFTGSDN